MSGGSAPRRCRGSWPRPKSGLPYLPKLFAPSLPHVPEMLPRGLGSCAHPKNVASKRPRRDRSLCVTDSNSRMCISTPIRRHCSSIMVAACRRDGLELGRMSSNANGCPPRSKMPSPSESDHPCAANSRRARAVSYGILGMSRFQSGLAWLVGPEGTPANSPKVTCAMDSRSTATESASRMYRCRKRGWGREGSSGSRKLNPTKKYTVEGYPTELRCRVCRTRSTLGGGTWIAKSASSASSWVTIVFWSGTTCTTIRAGPGLPRKNVVSATSSTV